jgi:four helix bundle protein
MDKQIEQSPWAKTFKELLVWKKSIDLVTNIYKLTSTFPRNEILGIVSQLRRASVSIPSNIAEGYGRRSRPDFVRFCQIAMGSLFEVQTQLIISCNLGYLNSVDFETIMESAKEIERMMCSFVERLKQPRA